MSRSAASTSPASVGFGSRCDDAMPVETPMRKRCAPVHSNGQRRRRHVICSTVHRQAIFCVAWPDTSANGSKCHRARNLHAAGTHYVYYKVERAYVTDEGGRSPAQLQLTAMLLPADNDRTTAAAARERRAGSSWRTATATPR